MADKEKRAVTPGEKMRAEIAANQEANTKIATEAGTSIQIAARARSIGTALKDDAKEAQAIKAAAEAFEAKSSSWSVWAKSLFGGASNEVAAKTAAVDAVEALGFTLVDAKEIAAAGCNFANGKPEQCEAIKR